MSLIVKARCTALAPYGESLADVAVLARAWTKSHVFIRRHNWHADCVEVNGFTRSPRTPWSGTTTSPSHMRHPACD